MNNFELLLAFVIGDTLLLWVIIRFMSSRLDENEAYNRLFHENRELHWKNVRLHREVKALKSLMDNLSAEDMIKAVNAYGNFKSYWNDIMGEYGVDE